MEASVGGEHRNVWQWLALGIGLVATLAVTIWVTRIARQALRHSPAGASE